MSSPIVFLLRDIIIAGQHDALDWLWHIVGDALSGQDIIVFGTSATNDTVSSLLSQDSDRWMSSEAWAAGWEAHWCLCAGNRWEWWSICISWVSLWWQKWAGCTGRHYEPANVQPCTATKSLILGKSPCPEQCVLVQNNAPHNTIWATRDILENQDVEVMDWPSKNPHMDPIEIIWDWKVVRIHDMDITL